MSDEVMEAFGEAVAEVLAEKHRSGRVLDLKVDGELTEMGIRITIHSPTARAVYEFCVDDDPEVLFSIMAMSKAIVVHQVAMMNEALLAEESEPAQEVSSG